MTHANIDPEFIAAAIIEMKAQVEAFRLLESMGRWEIDRISSGDYVVTSFSRDKRYVGTDPLLPNAIQQAAADRMRAEEDPA